MLDFFHFCRDIILDFLNNVLLSHQYWSDMKSKLQDKFSCCLLDEEMKEDFDLRAAIVSDNAGILLNRIQVLFQFAVLIKSGTNWGPIECTSCRGYSLTSHRSPIGLRHRECVRESKIYGKTSRRDIDTVRTLSNMPQECYVRTK